MITRIWSLMLVLLAALISATAPSQMIHYPSTANAVAGEPGTQMGIEPYPLRPGDEIQVALWTEKYHYYLNEDVTICFRVSHDAYFYLYATNADGRTIQLFPNAYDRNNFLQADVTYCVPDQNYRLVATAPVGREVLYAIATNYRQDWMSEPLSQRANEPFPTVNESPERIFARMQQQSERDRQAAEQASTTGRDQTSSPQAVPYRTPAAGTNVGTDVESRRLVAATGRAWQTIWIHDSPAYRPPIYRQPYRPPSGYRPSPTPTPTPVPPRYNYPYYDDNWRNDPSRPPYYVPSVPPDDYFPQDGPMGTMKISSSPDRADVFLDGVYFGRTPFTRELPAGKYDLVVRKAGYRPYERTVNLSANATESFTFRLRSN